MRHKKYRQAVRVSYSSYRAFEHIPRTFAARPGKLGRCQRFPIFLVSDFRKVLGDFLKALVDKRSLWIAS